MMILSSIKTTFDIAAWERPRRETLKIFGGLGVRAWLVFFFRIRRTSMCGIVSGGRWIMWPRSPAKAGLVI